MKAHSVSHPWCYLDTAKCLQFQLVVGLLLVLNSAAGLALVYQAPMDEAEWIVDSSVFECRMTQPIPIVGEAVFVHRAGEALRFYLSSAPSPMRKGQALLVSDAPVWKPQLGQDSLGYVPVAESHQPIRLERKMATRILAELEKGKAPRFSRLSWFADNEKIDIGLSSVNFRAAYKHYRQCLTELLPVNFEQIQRSRAYFKTAKWDITDETRARLDLVVRYAKADQRVNAFYIDGHTDNRADRHYNLELSRRRALAVSEYLIDHGIPEEYIVVRYHGERYPVARNDSPQNRAKNRRVTIRLERE